MRVQPAIVTGVVRNASTKLGHIVAGSLPCVVRSFKSESTKQIRRFIGNQNTTIWQRNYGVYPERSRRKHVIRNEDELYKIQEYITSNPLMWEKDENNLLVIPSGTK